MKDKPTYWSNEQLTSEQAIKIFNSELYKDMTSLQIVELQLFQKCLCVPFNVFHDALEDVLNRDIYTHEINHSDMAQEFLKIKTPPTLDEIIEMIPIDKRKLIKI